DPRIIGEHVDRLPPIEDMGEERVDLPAVGDVGTHRDRLATRRPHLVRHLLETVGIDVGERDARTFRGKATRDRTPDPRGAARAPRPLPAEHRHPAVSTPRVRRSPSPPRARPTDYAGNPNRTPSAVTSPPPRWTARASSSVRTRRRAAGATPFCQR